MAASDIFQQGTKLFYQPTPGTYTPIADPAQLQALAKQGAVKVGSPYLPLPTSNTPPVAPGNAPGASTTAPAVPAPVGGGSSLTTPTAPVQGSNMAFQQAFGKLMDNATKNQALQDQMQSLVRARYDGVTAVADPTLPPAVQEAIRNRDTSALDFQIQSMRQQLQGRSTNQVNALQYLVSGYQSDVQAAQQRQQQADSAIRDMLKTYGSTLSEVGVTQDELQQYENTGVMPPALGTKLMQASTLAQTKNEASQNKPFIIGQSTDSMGNKVNVYGQNVQDPKTGFWSVKQVSGPDVPNGNTSDSSSGVNVGGYDISSYATDPQHEQKVLNILNDMGQLTSVSQMDQYIQQKAKGSPVTGQMIADASQKYGVPWEMIMAMMQQDSSLGTAGKGAKTHNPGNVGNTDSGATKDYGTWQAGVDAVAQWLSMHPASSDSGGGVPGTTGQASIDATTQGYASKPVTGAGGLTQSAIDQAALQYVTTGTMPSIGLGSTGAAGQKKTAIMNRAGELGGGGNISANKANLKALTTSLSKQTDYANTVERSVGNAEHGFQQLMTAFQDSGINTSDSALLNKTMNEVAKKITGGKIFAFNAGLAEVGNEYANVFSRGGQVTEGARNRANDITNGNISMKDLMDVQKELQAQGGIVVQGAKDQVKSIQDQINGIVGGSSGSSSDSSKDPMGIR